MYEFGDEKCLAFDVAEQEQEQSKVFISSYQGQFVPKKKKYDWDNMVPEEIEFHTNRLSRWFNEYLERLGGLHYCDVPKVVGKAVSLEIGYWDAWYAFNQRYVGESNWTPYWKNRWFLSTGEMH